MFLYRKVEKSSQKDVEEEPFCYEDQYFTDTDCEIFEDALSVPQSGINDESL